MDSRDDFDRKHVRRCLRTFQQSTVTFQPLLASSSRIILDRRSLLDCQRWCFLPREEILSLPTLLHHWWLQLQDFDRREIKGHPNHFALRPCPTELATEGQSWLFRPESGFRSLVVDPPFLILSPFAFLFLSECVSAPRPQVHGTWEVHHVRL